MQNNWEDNQMVQTFINNENPSLEDTIEAYHFRDINMNLSIEHTMNFIVKKLFIYQILTNQMKKIKKLQKKNLLN